MYGIRWENGHRAWMHVFGLECWSSPKGCSFPRHCPLGARAATSQSPSAGITNSNLASSIGRLHRPRAAASLLRAGAPTGCASMKIERSHCCARRIRRRR